MQQNRRVCHWNHNGIHGCRVGIVVGRNQVETASLVRIMCTRPYDDTILMSDRPTK